MVIAKRYSGEKFRAWLRQSGILQLTAAEALGISKITINRICNDAQMPGDALKHRIWIFTAGAVEPNDWFNLDPAQLAGGDQGSGIRDQHAQAPQPLGAAA
ncbi:MAG: hypothetical protein DCC73_11500 [Proteobacteria bacterium]|nr:MAG: hypothetical protein DCC73_11500 [Pseudomonadota bacterium]